MKNLEANPKKVAVHFQAVACNHAQAHPQPQKTCEEMVLINSDGAVRPVLTSMNNSHVKPKKAAVRFQAVACNHAQAHPTYLVYAKSIVELAERCISQFMDTQRRSGFHYQRAIPIFIACLNSFSTRTYTKRVGLVQAARLIGVSRVELQAMAEAGEIRSMRVGRGYRFFELDLVYWIVTQPVTPHEAELATTRDPGRSRRPRRKP